jgi:uncharacterized protein YjbI with pentapeptide repeats
LVKYSQERDIITGFGDELGAAAFVLMLCLFYVLSCVLLKDKDFDWITRFVKASSVIFSTSFQGSNLKNASFANANLKRVNFSSSDSHQINLSGVRWKGAKEMGQSFFGRSVFKEPTVHKLLTSQNACGQDFSGSFLRGVNLSGANLAGASFKGGILSEAILTGANLQGSSLMEAQCLGVDFTGANLTGACIEDWNISSNTCLKNVHCDFVYLTQKERRPNSGVFQPGEFTKLFQEVLDTIDLIFQNGIDWKAFVRTFGQIQVQHEDAELSVQSIENKGDGVVVLKLNAAPGTDKAAVHQYFTEGYQVALKEAEARYKAQLDAKDEQITDYRQHNANMQEVVKLLASRPINVDVKATAESKAMQGDDNSRNISVGGDLNASGSTINLGEISGQVSNQINQLPDPDPDPGQPDLKALLTQLKTAVETDIELSEVEKKEALGEVAKLAEAGSQPKEGAMQRMAKRATAALKSITDPLTEASKLAIACKSLLPMILTLF